MAVRAARFVCGRATKTFLSSGATSMSFWRNLIIAIVLLVGVIVYFQRDRIGLALEPAEPDHRPNIVLIYMDDVDCESVMFDWDQPSNGDKVAFPTIKKMVDEGISFTNFHVTTPVCGPSRACLLTGSYSHRNNFRVNQPEAYSACGFSGGYEVFDKDKQLGNWLNQTGYTTAFVGKYLHHGFVPNSEKEESWTDIKPKGWEYCIAYMGAVYFNVYFADFKNPSLVSTENRYRTDAETDHCIEVFEQNSKTRARKPLVMCWAPLGAHLPQHGEMEAPRHQDWKTDLLPKQLEVFEKLQDPKSNSAEGHPLMKSRPFDKQDMDGLTDMWNARLRSIKAFDENLAKLRARLEAMGELENTIFMFTSDHGYSIGAHKHIGKRLPYDRVTKVPFFACGPGIPKGKTCDALLANIDIAPTLIAMTGDEPPRDIDGISFSHLLTNPEAEFEREAILIENWEFEFYRDNVIPAQYVSLRLPHEVFTEWADGRREYYDLETDPNQLNNDYSNLPEDQKEKLWNQLHSIRKTECDPIISDSLRSELLQPEKYCHAIFTGHVEDDRGVERVELEVFDRVAEEYWNGEGWQDEQTTLLANLGCERGLITEFEIKFAPEMKQTTNGEQLRRLVFSVAATDLNGNTTWKRDFYRHEFRPDEPHGWIDVPVNKGVVSSPVTFEGRATDNLKIKEVRIVLRDMSNNKFWDGEAWSDELHQLPADLTPAPDETGNLVFGENIVKFSYTFDGDINGHIFVAARPYDESLNFDQQFPSRRIWDVTRGEEGEFDAAIAAENKSADDESAETANSTDAAASAPQ